MREVVTVDRSVKRSLLDRVIAYYSPQKAVDRLRARTTLALAGGYVGASKSRRQTSQWKVSAGSADADILPDLPALRERSRDLARNAPIAGGAINTVVTKVVGTGLSLVSSIDRDALGMDEAEAQDWQEKTEREFRLWAESQQCDASEAQNFYELQELMFRSVLESGDCFALMPMIPGASPYETRVQFIEADRVSNRDNKADSLQMAGGITRNQYGAPRTYHIMRSHPGDLARTQREWDDIPAYAGDTGRKNILHLMRKTRIGQIRGVPYLAPVIEPIKQMDRYTEAEIMAAVVSSMFTVFVKSEQGGAINPIMPAETGATTADKDMKMASGLIVGLNPMESIEIANPGRPNTAFDPFVQAILRQIGVALELPFEILIKHFTSSYTAARAAMLDAWTFFRGRREWLAEAFCQQVYEAVMFEAVAKGRIIAPGFFDDYAIRKAYLGSQWIGDPQGFLDPLKEVDAQKKRLDIGVTTLAAESIAYDGIPWEAKHAQQVKERNARRKDGLHSEVVAERFVTDQGQDANNKKEDEEDQDEEDDEKNE